MRVILLGSPGSGKGTQAKLLSGRLGLTQVGTGDILREAIRMGTTPGKQAEPYVVSGRLVPDALINDLVADRFRRPDRPDNFVMDGYPRTRTQAEAFTGILHEQHLCPSAVVLLHVPDNRVIARLSGRRVCPTCKTSYHLTDHPPKRPGVCDNGCGRLVQRDDDREETVRERLRVYHENTDALISYYRDRGLLREVSGEGNIEQIYANLVSVLQAESTC